MIFCIKNFCKNKNSSLVAKSIKHFGNYKIFLFNIYINDINHEHLDKTLFENIIDKKGKYDLGSGSGSKVNGFYFSEGINLIVDYFKTLDEKIVILDEDHYFLNGNTIKELELNDYDLAWAFWPSPDQHPEDVAANIISINPKSLSHLFPLPEKLEYIEKILREELLLKVDKNKVYKIKNRNYLDYFGDGHFTNNVNEIENSLKSIGIL